MDTAPFVLDLNLDTKAVDGPDDHFYIEGIASDVGIDRAGEAFEEGAFEKSVQRFLDTNPVLLYHHNAGRGLGVVEELEAKGGDLWMRARVDAPEPGTENADVVRRIKSGSIKGLSVGGTFKRRPGPDGRPRIHDAELLEISVTPLPVNPRTLFTVAQKAFGETAGDRVLAWFEEKMKGTEERFSRLG